MALQGHAAITAFDAPVVVVVEQTPIARFAFGWTAIVLPMAFLLALEGATPGASLQNNAGRWLQGFAVSIAVVGVLALLRGTVRARMLLDNKEVDRVEWTLRPYRRLEAKVGKSTLRADFVFNPNREVEFYVDDVLLKKVEVQ